MPDKRVDKRNEQFKSLNNDAALKLVNEIDRLKESKEKMNVGIVDNLIKLYENLGVQLKKTYDTLKPDSDEAKMYMKMNKRFSKDYSALIRYKRKTEKIEKELDKFAQKEDRDDYLNKNTYTIEEFFDNTRTRTLNLSESEMSELSSIGATSSTRYKINFSLDDEPVEGKKKGDVCMGFFTPENTSPVTKNRIQYFKQKHQKNIERICQKYPKAAGALNKIPAILYMYIKDPIMTHLQVYPERFGTDMSLDDSIDNIFKNIDNTLKEKVIAYDNVKKHQNLVLNYPEFVEAVKSKKVEFDPDDVMKNCPELKEDYLRLKAEVDQCRSKLTSSEKKYAFIEATEAFMKELNAYDLRVGNGINHFTDVAQRNALSSAFADYFGCPDALAYSEKMKIKTMKNGEKVTIKGTMMMPGKGFDPSSPDDNNPVNDRNGLSYNDTKGLVKSVASLQFLDYLTGNTDRHTGNFFLQFDENGKVIAVQGIDNDNSFGATADLNKTHQNFVALSDLRIIPKSMADAVKAANPEVLAILMQGYGLDDQEIKKTLERINDAKVKLEQFERLYEGTDPTYINPDVPRIVPDDEMDKFLVNEQLATQKADNRKNNIFGKMVAESNKLQGMKFTHENMGKEVRNKALDVAGSFFGMVYDLDFLKKYEVPDSLIATLKTTSKPLLNDNIKEFQKICTSIPDLMVVKSEKSKLTDYDKDIDYHVYKMDDNFGKLKESALKTLNSLNTFCEATLAEANSNARMNNSKDLSGGDKYEQYETANAEIKFYQSEILKLKENLLKNNKQLNDQENQPSDEEKTKLENDNKKVQETINNYTQMLQESVEQKNTLSEDPEVKVIIMSINARNKLTRFVENLEKVENAAKKLEKYDDMAEDIYCKATATEPIKRKEDKKDVKAENAIDPDGKKKGKKDSHADSEKDSEKDKQNSKGKKTKTKKDILKAGLNIVKARKYNNPYEGSEQQVSNISKANELEAKNKSDKFFVTGINKIGAKVESLFSSKKASDTKTAASKKTNGTSNNQNKKDIELKTTARVKVIPSKKKKI